MLFDQFGKVFFQFDGKEKNGQYGTTYILYKNMNNFK